MTELRRELGLRDLVLFHIAAIFGLRWLAVAAAIGYSSMVIWLLAFLLFFLPQTYVVLRLSQKWSVEGGLYEWTKMAMGPFHGFVSGWCYWVNNIVYYPTLLTIGAGFATYIFAPRTIGLDENRMYVVTFSLIALWLILGLNIIGLKIGKWVQNIGGLATWIPAGLVMVLGILYVAKFGAATPFSSSAFFPEWNFDTFGTWASLCFALAGFELISLMGGEVKNPEVNIPRSIVIAGVLGVFIYILGTLALIVSVPREKVSLLSGIVQAINVQTEAFGLAFVTNIIAIPLVLMQFGGVGAWLTGSGRVLYVVGVDRYLPKSFSKVHPKWGTPYVSILTQGIFSTFFILLSVAGSTVKQFYNLLIDFNLIVYFIPYLYLFFSYFQFMRRGEMKFNLAGVLSAVLGFVATAVAIVFSLLPGEDVENVLLHELKLIGGTILMVGIGLFLYWNGYRKARSEATPQT